MRGRNAMICRLCGSKAILVDSHLLPAFAVRRFMRTSPTGGSRSVGNPNLREQDYLKKPLLCANCDNQRFGLREKVFAEAIDSPFETKRLSLAGISFTEELRYFVASLAWRIIVWGLGERDGEELNDSDKSRLKTAEVALRRYLLDETHYPEQYVPHVIMAPLFTQGAPPGINALLHSSLGATIEANGDNLWVVGFMSGYMIVLVIALEDAAFIAWTFNTWLMPSWKLIPGRITHDKRFWDSLAHFAKKIEESRLPLSERQDNNIERRVKAIEPEVLRSNPHVFAIFVDYLNRSRH